MSNVDKLTTILKALYEKPGATVQDALDALQRLAPTPTEREKTRMHVTIILRERLLKHIATTLSIGSHPALASWQSSR